MTWRLNRSGSGLRGGRGLRTERHEVKHILLIAAALSAASAPAAASDYRAGLAALRAQDLRVATIGWRLATANVPLCRDISPQAGIVVYDLAQYAPEARADARSLFALGGPATVAAVVPRSAAATAGLEAGDTIEAIDGVALPTQSVRTQPSFDGVDRTYVAIERAAARGPVTLAIRRGGVTRTIRFTPDRGCTSFVQLVPERSRNANADGRTVTITTAVADATRDDDELAIVIAHELAHNILRHRVRLDEEKVSRGLFAGLGRNGAALRASEDEADRVGLYLAARAGYDPAAGARFWERFGRATDPVIGDGTHPGWRTRVAALRATAAEIVAKRAAGRPIVPEAPKLPVP